MAELLAPFRGLSVGESDLLLADGRHFALAAFEDEGLRSLIDLDDPQELVQRSVRPSMVASRDRQVTQRISAGLYEEGLAGFSWWSTLEPSWANVTCFAERAVNRLGLAGDPEPLTLRHPAIREASRAIGVRLDGRA